jgi:hypothetical protein
MFDLILTFLNSLLVGFRSRLELQPKILVLRHQLTVLQRTQRPKRLILNRADRCLWVWLSRIWCSWRSALLIVKAETVIAWHRQGFRRIGLGRFVMVIQADAAFRRKRAISFEP